MSKTFSRTALAIGTCALIACVSLPIVGCSGNGNNGSGGATSTGQNDSRYQNQEKELNPPTTKEAEDGSVLHAPEGYVPAYQSELEDNTLNEKTLNEAFEVAGVKYTVYAPSKVHASGTIEGTDSFLVDVEMENTNADEAATAGGTTLFFFSPDGLYTNDLIEQAKDEERMQKIMEYEEKGETVPPEVYDELYGHEDDTVAAGEKTVRTVEIPYRGDGTYTVEVRDFINNQLYRVPMEIKLNA